MGENPVKDRPPNDPRRHPNQQGPGDNNNGDNNNNNGQGPLNNPNARNFWLLIMGVVAVLVVLMMTAQGLGGGQAISFSDLRLEAENQQISEILVRGDSEVVVSYNDGRRMTYTKSYNDNVLDLLGYENTSSAPFEYSSEAADNSGAFIFNLLIILVPSAIILYFFWRMMRNVRSGQDQAKVIKSLLGSMVPGLHVFLDVDNLESIDALEEYIDATATVMIFVSKGYFKSGNCLREARCTVKKGKPITLVHDSAVYLKSYAPLEEIKDAIAMNSESLGVAQMRLRTRETKPAG